MVNFLNLVSPISQFDLVVHDPELDPESDPSLDPSVRFFGVDWQQIFARCFSLSINFRIFRAQVKTDLLVRQDLA